MALTREKIEYGEIRNLFAFKRHQRYRLFLKKCMNRWIRRKAKHINLTDDNLSIKKEYKGWEY